MSVRRHIGVSLRAPIYINDEIIGNAFNFGLRNTSGSDELKLTQEIKYSVDDGNNILFRRRACSWPLLLALLFACFTCRRIRRYLLRRIIGDTVKIEVTPCRGMHRERSQHMKMAESYTLHLFINARYSSISVKKVMHCGIHCISHIKKWRYLLSRFGKYRYVWACQTGA